MASPLQGSCHPHSARGRGREAASGAACWSQRAAATAARLLGSLHPTLPPNRFIQQGHPLFPSGTGRGVGT